MKLLLISLPIWASLALVSACGDDSDGGDMVLDATLEPRSGEVIDCAGGAITARTPAETNRGVSEPDTLIFLGPDVRGVEIRNCTLEATFPIVAQGGGDHVIAGNEIRASSRGVWLFSSSNNLIDDNLMRTKGRNIQINGDSDDTVVSNNDIGFVPDGESVDGNPGWTVRGEPGGVGVGTFSYPGVNNVIINGRLVQDVTFADTRPERTQVLRNTIHNEGGGELGIIFATRSSEGHAEGNQVYGGGLGLAVFGYDDDAQFVEPGTCSEDPTMRCALGDLSTGCALPGFEPRGSCTGSNEVIGGGRVVAPSFVDNRVSGAEVCVSAGLTDGLRIEANDLEGCDTGVQIWGYALDQSSIFGNRALDNQVGLALEDDNFTGVETPGLAVSYNDFGANQRPFDARSLVLDANWEVVEVVAYSKPTSLPDNWWGSDPCGFPANPDGWAATNDPSPAAAAIAEAWRDETADTIDRCPP